MKVSVLGSASGVPTKKRYPTSIVLIVDENIYLFDCGEPCSSLLVRKGFPYNPYSAIKMGKSCKSRRCRKIRLFNM